jgi:hypothetical protein
MEDGASMLSTPTRKETDPHSPVTIDPAVILAARADRVSSAAGTDAARRAPDRQAYHAAEAPAPTVDTTFRPSDVDALRPDGGRSSIATWAVRTGLAVALAVCSAVAAAAWQTYGDQAQEIIGRWMPRISLSTPAADKVASPAQPDATTAQTAAIDNQTQTPPAAAQAADSAASTTAAATTTAPALATQDSAQLLQSMAHDLAAMGQQIADLKASIAQLKAGQDQMARDMARASERAAEHTAEAKPFDPKAIEQTLRPRPAPRPAVATTAPLHRPRPIYSPPAQPIATPPTPAPMPLPSAPQPQISSDPGVESVVRPPMPVR